MSKAARSNDNIVDLKAAARTAIIQKSHALGNSKRGFKEVASDLINREGRKQLKVMAEGMFLSRATVERVADCDEFYRPQAETLERVLKYFSVECTFGEVHIQPRFQNKEKAF